MDGSHRRALLTLTTSVLDPIALRKASDVVRARRLRLARGVTVLLALCGVLCVLSLAASLARPHAAVAATRLDARAHSASALAAPPPRVEGTPTEERVKPADAKAELATTTATSSPEKIAAATPGERTARAQKRKAVTPQGGAKKAVRAKVRTKRR